LIETGANQAYIFDTNRLRHVVGGSYLVREVGTGWVPEIADACGAEAVLAISGKALLLAGDPATGRAVIARVSERALREAPGLEVTGVVGPGFDPDVDWLPGGGDDEPAAAGQGPMNHAAALVRTYELLEAARDARPSPLLRDPMLPWFEVCRDSGLPAAGIEEHADGGPAAAAVLAKSRIRHRAGHRVRGLLADLPDVVPADLDDLRHDGWIAVIHADGNGVGRMFVDFPARALRAARAMGDSGGLSLRRHVELLAAFTDQLDVATEAALGIAVRTVAAGQGIAGTILPVVVGGDDVTVVCHARLALGLVRALVLAFEEQTAAQPAVRSIAGSGLTAAAGIAYVKPHHPFSAAYGLAEELTASAKQAARAGGREVSAADLHVAFESTLADLASLRRRMAVGGLARHGGPYVITAADSPSAGARDIRQLDAAMETVSALSSSMAHDLRDGLARGPVEYARRIRRAAQSADLPDGVRPADIERLAPDVVAGADGTGGADGADRADGPADGRIVRLLDALLLESIARVSGPAGPGPGSAIDGRELATAAGGSAAVAAGLGTASGSAIGGPGAAAAGSAAIDDGDTGEPG
jgi:hypothetical protein